MMNKKKKTKLARRITWRVTLITLLVNIFVVSLVELFVIVVSEDESKTRSQYIIDDISSNLQSMMFSVEMTAKNNVAELEKHLDDPEKVFEALEHELLLNPYYRGCFAAFEPDYYPSKGRWFEAYVRLEDSTHVERLQIGGADHDYFQYEWYQKGLLVTKDQSGYLSDMYFDDDGAQAPITSYVVPIHDKKGRVVGVYGIDIVHNWLIKTIADEEKKGVEREGLGDDEGVELADSDKYYFCTVVDSKGQHVAGSDYLTDDIEKKVLAKDSTDFESVTLHDTKYFISAKRLGKSDWTLIVTQHWMFVYFMAAALSVFILFFMLVGFILIIFTTWRSINRVTRPLRHLTASAQQVAKGNFETQLPTFKRNDEITQLRDSFEIMQHSLTSYVDELKKTTASKATMESELNIAHRIQMSMLPKMDPPFPDRDDIDLYGTLKPAKAVGGDLYDFFIIDDKLYFCIGDVSGKGVPASLVMAVTRTLFRNIASHVSDPDRTVQAMNETLVQSNGECMFVTIFVGVLDIKTGHLRYCNGGHDEPYVGHSLLPCEPNLPIGVDMDKEFIEQEAEVPAGATIFLYTDGLTEAENINHELFGDERVAEVIRSTDTETITAHELIDKMSAAVSNFVGDTEQSDDLTMLAIRIKK